MNKIRIAYMGTPLFAQIVLEKLIENYQVDLVITQPDKEVGRKRLLTPCPVKKLALENNIEVFQPLKIRNDYQKIIDLQPDLIITCAYGQIVPKEVLECPKYGCINVHASLLPKLRGAAPIHHALINGEEETGITIMYMDESLDTGNMISKKSLKIEDEDNVETLSLKLANLGANLLIETIPRILNETNESIKQDDSLSTYANLVKREDELINFNDIGKNIINKIRGTYPMAYFKLDDAETKVLEASFVENNVTEPSYITIVDKNNLAISCQDGLIYLKKIKPFGKKEMNVKDYLNGINKESLKNKKVN
ncbi:MAG: methionyl-tRNA formyltransferase [Bacilli bacterium]|nr:methionyl-tRNA formyltransferase [Bacilli bacterium]